ncbi:MAG: metallophosphoesterase [Anaerolineae bacterium]|nr:metallophosphoesterase [Anaerolineae bacterium]
MKRRSARQRRQTYLWILSLVVAFSMVCSFVIMMRPPRPRPTPTPIPLIETSTPTSQPTAAPATAGIPTPQQQATPTSSASFLQKAPTPFVVSKKENFIFAVCGDNRGGWQVYKKILESVERDGAAFLINTGDLVNHGHEAEFKEFSAFMKEFSLPFYPVPGNHDNGDGLLTAYLKYSGAPARNYSFDYGLLHFSMVDSSMGELSKKDFQWLTQDLDSTKQPVKIVVLHYPPFDPAGTDHIMFRGNQEFMKLMSDKGVQYVFAGHIHSYDDAVRDGVHYFITGGAGAPLYPEPNRPAFYHYVRVHVNGTKLRTEVVRIEE